jgi:hypothetical protein
VWKALGHDEHGRCPAGVDWRIPDQESAIRAAAIRAAAGVDLRTLDQKYPDHATAIRAAEIRAVSQINFALAEGRQPRTLESIPACGWWWCGQNLKPNQWADLASAVEILTEAGIDPNREGVAYKAGTYAEMEARAGQWERGKSEHVLSFLQANKESLEGTRGIHLLRGLALAERAAHPRGHAGPPVDAPYHQFLNEPSEEWKPSEKWEPSEKWTPAVAASVLVLFALEKRRLREAVSRADDAWFRGGELNAGRE